MWQSEAVHIEPSCDAISRVNIFSFRRSVSEIREQEQLVDFLSPSPTLSRSLVHSLAAEGNESSRLRYQRAPSATIARVGRCRQEKENLFNYVKICWSIDLGLRKVFNYASRARRGHEYNSSTNIIYPTTWHVKLLKHFPASFLLASATSTHAQPHTIASHAIAKRKVLI